MKKRILGYIDYIKWAVKELIKTFSGEPSYFSSKKIERMLFVISALIFSHYWFWTHVKDLTYEQVIAFVSMHLGFAGYSLLHTQREKRNNKIENENGSETT